MAIDKITTPAVADDSVTLAKMAPGTDGNIISYDASGNPVAVATGSAGQVLTSAGAGAPPTFAAAGGITQADTWRMNDTYSVSAGTDTLINQYWERSDNTGYGRIGTGMTESSGVFTFPETGIYYIDHGFRTNASGSSNYIVVYLSGTTDNSNYNQFTEAYIFSSSGSVYASGSANCLFDVTNTSNCKVKFTMRSASNIVFAGNSDENQTYATFIRLGDT